MLKKKQTAADFLRSWGIHDPIIIKAGLKYLRYRNPPEKGVYWYYFSKYVRERDVEEYGTCISCGKPIAVDTCDAGHFIAASVGGRDLLFDFTNVNAECSRCNAWDEGHLFGYEKGLDERYGEGTAERLKQQYFAYKNGGSLKDFKASEYAEKIKQLPTYQHAINTTLHKEYVKIKECR
jgi:hypothetical protein